MIDLNSTEIHSSVKQACNCFKICFFYVLLPQTHTVCVKQCKLGSSLHQLNTGSTDITAWFRICIQYLTTTTGRTLSPSHIWYSCCKVKVVPRKSPFGTNSLSDVTFTLFKCADIILQQLIAGVFAPSQQSSIVFRHQTWITPTWRTHRIGVAPQALSPIFPSFQSHLILDPCTCAARGRSCLIPLVCLNPQSSDKAQRQSSKKLEWVNASFYLDILSVILFFFVSYLGMIAR